MPPNSHMFPRRIIWTSRLWEVLEFRENSYSITKLLYNNSSLHNETALEDYTYK